MFTRQHRILCLTLFLVLFALDQGSKQWVMATVYHGQRIDLLPFLRLTLEFNEGIGLSMFSFLYDWLEKGSQLIFGVVNISISIAVLYVFRNVQRGVTLVGWTMVIAGALGNAVDRFVALWTPRTGVVDFIWVHWQSIYNFPVFNVADSAITLGFAVILIDMLFLDRPNNTASVHDASGNLGNKD